MTSEAERKRKRKKACISAPLQSTNDRRQTTDERRQTDSRLYYGVADNARIYSV